MYLLVTPHNLWDISSQTRDWTEALNSESAKSWPLELQGIAQYFYLVSTIWFMIFKYTNGCSVQSRL